MHAIWAEIPEFPDYMVSDTGLIWNSRRETLMSLSRTPFGHVKVSLVNAQGRQTRSVALLVAEAFIQPPDLLCDQVIVLDGDLGHVEAKNLAWRPRWFAWKYARQLRIEQPRHLQNLEVRNVVTGDLYSNIVSAGMTEGLLFYEVWRSTYTGKHCYPTHAVFEVLGV